MRARQSVAAWRAISPLLRRVLWEDREALLAPLLHPIGGGANASSSSSSSSKKSRERARFEPGTGARAGAVPAAARDGARRETVPFPREGVDVFTSRGGVARRRRSRRGVGVPSRAPRGGARRGGRRHRPSAHAHLRSVRGAVRAAGRGCSRGALAESLASLRVPATFEGGSASAAEDDSIAYGRGPTKPSPEGWESAAGATVQALESAEARLRELARAATGPDASPDVEKVVDMECAVASALAWAPAAHCKALRSLSARLEVGQHWVEAAEAAATAAGVTVQALAAGARRGEAPRDDGDDGDETKRPGVVLLHDVDVGVRVERRGRAFARGRVRVARRRRPSLSRLRRRRRGVRAMRRGGNLRGESSRASRRGGSTVRQGRSPRGGGSRGEGGASRVGTKTRLWGFSASARRRRRYISLVAPAPPPARRARERSGCYPRPRDRPRRPPRFTACAWWDPRGDAIAKTPRGCIASREIEPSATCSRAFAGHSPKGSRREPRPRRSRRAEIPATTRVCTSSRWSPCTTRNQHRRGRPKEASASRFPRARRSCTTSRSSRTTRRTERRAPSKRFAPRGVVEERVAWTVGFRVFARGWWWWRKRSRRCRRRRPPPRCFARNRAPSPPPPTRGRNSPNPRAARSSAASAQARGVGRRRKRDRGGRCVRRVAAIAPGKPRRRGQRGRPRGVRGVLPAARRGWRFNLRRLLDGNLRGKRPEFGKRPGVGKRPRFGKRPGVERADDAARRDGGGSGRARGRARVVPGDVRARGGDARKRREGRNRRERVRRRIRGGCRTDPGDVREAIGGHSKGCREGDERYGETFRERGRGRGRG